jgi:hypothetical protein
MTLQGVIPTAPGAIVVRCWTDARLGEPLLKQPENLAVEGASMPLRGIGDGIVDVIGEPDRYGCHAVTV